MFVSALLLIPLFLVIFLALITLLFVGYKRKVVCGHANFKFTRKCLGWALLFFAFSVTMLGFGYFDDDLFGWVTVGQFLSWVAMVFVFRGLFEILALGDGITEKVPLSFK